MRVKQHMHRIVDVYDMPLRSNSFLGNLHINVKVNLRGQILKVMERTSRRNSKISCCFMLLRSRSACSVQTEATVIEVSM